MELRSPALNMNENLATNLMYGAAVCRLCYYRKSDPLPEAGDVEGMEPREPNAMRSKPNYVDAGACP